MKDLKSLLAFNADLCKTEEEAIASEKTLAFFPDKNGKLYKRIKSPLGVCIEEATEVPFGDEIKTGIRFELPKIKLSMLAQIVSFFRDICNDTRDEVFCRIYMNKETKEYEILVPKQTVSSASVNYKIEDPYYEDECIAIMDIHSHDTMGAFFSGTDDKDERTPGRLYMVLGKLNTHSIEFKLRTFVDKHVMVDFFEIFEKPNFNVDCELPITIQPSEETLINAIFETVVEYPEEWKEQVERRTYANSSFSYSGSYGGYGQRTSHYSKTNFGNGQLSLFGDKEEDLYDLSSRDDMETEDIGFCKSIVAKSFDKNEDDFDEDELDMPGSELDAQYENGIDAGNSVADTMEENTPAFIQGLIEGLEGIGLLDDIISALRKNGQY